MFSPEFWNRGVQGGGAQSTIVSNPAPILRERHYCAVDARV